MHRTTTIGIFLWIFQQQQRYITTFSTTLTTFIFTNSNINTWNTTRQSGINIIGGSFLGGNFWANPDGTGFSQTCKDVNGDGICDKSYILDANNIDYLPLAKDKIPPKSVSKLKNVSYASSISTGHGKTRRILISRKSWCSLIVSSRKMYQRVRGIYNATNFEPNTKHTISTWTVDMNGNINKTWTNRSAWTAK